MYGMKGVYIEDHKRSKDIFSLRRTQNLGRQELNSYHLSYLITLNEVINLFLQYYINNIKSEFSKNIILFFFPFPSTF